MFRHLLISMMFLLITGIATAQTSVQHFNEGIKLKDQKKYTEALVSFKKAISLNENYKEALYYAGWCNAELKEYSEALIYLQRAKAIWPNEAKVYLEIGYANDKLNKKTEAKDNYNRCILLKSDYALAYKYLANLYFDETDYKNALENFNFYVRYEPNITSDEVYYRKGYSENELGKYKDAVASLTKANELYADDASTYNELGYAYKELENADDAIINYKKALKINPRSIAGNNGIGDVYKDLKKEPKEAVKYYLKTIEADPKNKKANYSVGWCYNDMEKYNDAVPYLKKALEIDSKYVSAITELGYSEYALQNYNDALVQFKKSIAIKKTELNLYYAGLCYVEMKQKSEALKMHTELKAMNSDYADRLKKKIDAM